MGRGMASTVCENDGLIKAWLIEVNNPIRGTDQSGKEFWRRVLKGWLDLLRGESGAAWREKRDFDSMGKQCGKIVAGVVEFLDPSCRRASPSRRASRRTPT